MVTASPIDQDELIQFLYLCPVGIARIDLGGTISLLTAKGSQLLMPHAGAMGLENLFDVLDRHDPSLRGLTSTSAEFGMLCEHKVIRFKSTSVARKGDQHLAFTLLKISQETIMAVFEDVTRVIEAEAETLELVASTAIERGRSELATEVLHDIGNAVVGIGTRTASLLEDSEWSELNQLAKLGGFLATRSDALSAALGEKKASALTNLIDEIHSSLDSRRRRINESMRTFSSSVHHVQEILNLHRHYARQSPQGGRERISLKVLAEDALTIHAAALEKRSIVVERRFAPGLPKLSLDRTRMIQVLVNLLKNACEAFDVSPSTEGRKIVMEIAAGSDGSELCLQIRDNACGFPPERAELLFEKDTSTKGRGSGLGLYHCRKVVESHRGTLVMRSDGPGQGATSILTLPHFPKREADHANLAEHESAGN